ncbi:alkaline phosphatase [Photobacterium iliopiscarium]|jgi:predicted AlkP superfamily pyrophosphatase or phosphodiesterase|uniref:Alkaline phosphatase family protein n=1 Tax=Photobacterium iliopiscarium TaxID=56192 RepID=A0ABX5GXR0_9GAMM|nr:alkaline phosphatase family protein [Photobacterium iliopiscarium]KJG13900.1 alkaline phosphatase [Photobacterium iliopiscarium]KJG26696.1 alkaline phosphatase [Photobacterium iliopiscarium]PST96258.1 alkaline phosphatase family protein [Photobacterium iliopiscarium]PST99775.1 alkaline phosphatase family protein [Photobacterium iliopiscarium]PSV85169.1 alkaline phosphatase family protein [Photobacterium iliopiscarium]
MKYKILCYITLTSALLIPITSLAAPPKPKLVVQITVDALRGDLLERYKANFGNDGFRYLMDNGTYYTNAYYQHGNTETIVGHVSLATGAPPSVHGMVGNVWYDRNKERLVYNVEDGNYQMLNAGAGVNKATEIDPTQKIATKDGRSPDPILATTFSDELAISNNGVSKIFSVSVKDRGAISLGGHLGKAFWFSKAQSEFVTSNYYYDKYPQWVTDWNQQKLAEQYSNTRWELSLPPEKYTVKESNPDYKVDLDGFKRTFPHPYSSVDNKYYSTTLTVSPAGDELTENFASTLLKQENLGKGTFPDYLSVSFSSNDYVIHMYGPTSLETEDNLIRLDKTIAKLLKNIDQQVGLENTLIVLSADHGASEAPAVVNALGGHQPATFDQKQLISPQLLTRLKTEFSLGEDAIRLYAQPYIYLNHNVIKKKGVSLEKVQMVVAEELLKINGIAYAVTSTDIEKNQVPNTHTMQLVKNNYHPARSGDVYIVYQPRNFINDMDGLTIASTHGSPWRYDTYVPVIFAGYNIDDKQISREITPYDIAPTLSSILGITQPSGATGQILTEVIKN